MAAPAIIRELVDRFPEPGSVSFMALKETAVRREFIDQLFIALDWDVENRWGTQSPYKEVILEDQLRVVGSRVHAPDYAFRIGGRRKFFVEAKKPSVNLQEDPRPAYQLRRYGWSANLPLSILSDFQEFCVYDCTIEPSMSERSDSARPLYIRYTDYEAKWDTIYSLFSRKAVLEGSLNTFGENLARQRGSKNVDSAFLRELDRWRLLLAQDIAIRNKSLYVGELNYVVQAIMDRIIFLRICEERGIEPYERLKLAAEDDAAYKQLTVIFRDADDRYNSGLFHFHRERGRTEPEDDLTLTLDVGNDPLRSMIGSLYYPHPYEYSIIPHDVIGRVYEQFLGKVIVLGDNRSVTIDLKPEVLKAGGVFYTPPFVVEHIVESTLGRLLEGKTPAQISNLRILDPACGSGSFLIVAYQYLLDWHRKYYFNDGPEKHKKVLYQAHTGEWKLMPSERKRILLNNIFAVDIDPMAVDKTRSSLLPMVLEDADAEVLAVQLRFAHERHLPDLGSNLKCGNSLVGDDDFRSAQTTFIENIDDSVEPPPQSGFDWPSQFPQAFNRPDPGFDIVIGNPPYVRQELLGDVKTYFQRHYATYHGTADLYVYFIERSMSLLRDGGHFGMIVANKWMRANYGGPLRQWMKKQRIEEIIDFGDLPVFQNVTTYPCILHLSKNPPNPTFPAAQAETLRFTSLRDHADARMYVVDQANLADSGWSLIDKRQSALQQKIEAVGKPLVEYLEYGENTRGRVLRGILTGLNEAFVLDKVTRDRLLFEDPRSADIIKPFVMGRDVGRYRTCAERCYVILMPRGWTNIVSGGISDAWGWLQANYSAVAAHLQPFANAAQVRWDKGDYWWELRACDYYEELDKPKIIYASVAQRGTFTLDKQGAVIDKTCYFIPANDPYLLGLLNSKLLLYYFSNIAVQRRGGYFEYLGQYVEQLPIALTTAYRPGGSSYRDQVANKVGSLQKVYQALEEARTPHDKGKWQHEAEVLERQIDNIVYAIYGLSEDEIALVELRSKQGRN
jgi:TaqI-like C-terminal specificity domain/Eco57I restriction-modification methylase/N-6 DNA Methylase